MNARALLGLFVVSAGSFAAVEYVRESPWFRSLRERLTDHALQRTEIIRARFDVRPKLDPGDPVYAREGEAFAPLGHVLSIGWEGTHYVAELEVDPVVTRRFGSATQVIAMAPRGDLLWAGRTLLPPPLREQLLTELQLVWQHEGRETMRRLQPFLSDLLDEVVAVLKATLPEVLAANQQRMNAFLEVLRKEIYPAELQPALQEVLFPRLEQEVSEVAASIMGEVASRVEWGDAAGVVWAAFKEKIGLGDRGDVEAKLIAILQKSALPVFRERGPELAKAAMATTVEAMNDPQVQRALDRAATAILAHSTFRTYVGEVAQQWFLENARLKATLAMALSSAELRTPLEDLWRRTEPIVERYLEEILTRADRAGMDHQLVRVLRRTVLQKDRRYVLLVDAGVDCMDVEQPLTGVIGNDL